MTIFGKNASFGPNLAVFFGWCEDANSKLFEVVTVADVDVEKHVNDSLVQIWKLNLCPIAFSPKIVRPNDR